MTDLLLYEDEIRSVEGPDASRGGPEGTARSLTIEAQPTWGPDAAPYPPAKVGCEGRRSGSPGAVRYARHEAGVYCSLTYGRPLYEDEIRSVEG